MTESHVGIGQRARREPTSTPKRKRDAGVKVNVCPTSDPHYRLGTGLPGLQRALDNGVTKEEISEMITHLAFYSGWPASMTAANVAREVFEKNP